MEASELFEALKAFFNKNFYGQFKARRNQTDQHVVFYHIFQEQGLMISVHTPLVYNPPEVSYSTKKKMLFVCVEQGSGKSLELRPSRISLGWESVLKEKIEILHAMINDIQPCIICKKFPFPKIESSTKRNPNGTKFVSYYCSTCRKYYGSTYGTGLKSILHKHLKDE